MSSVIESIAMESSTNLHALLAEADLGLYNGDDIRKLTGEKFFWLLDHSLKPRTDIKFPIKLHYKCPG